MPCREYFFLDSICSTQISKDDIYPSTFARAPSPQFYTLILVDFGLELFKVDPPIHPLTHLSWCYAFQHQKQTCKWLSTYSGQYIPVQFNRGIKLELSLFNFHSYKLSDVSCSLLFKCHIFQMLAHITQKNSGGLTLEIIKKKVLGPSSMSENKCLGDQ